MGAQAHVKKYAFKNLRPPPSPNTTPPVLICIASVETVN